MKILYVITSTQTGGAEKFLTELVRVSSQKHEVGVVCLKPLGELAPALKAAGAREVRSLGGKGFLHGLGVRDLSRMIDAFKPDVVHAFLYRAMQLCRLACAGKPCKLICSPHFDMARRNFFLRLLDRFLRHTDALCVAESFSTAQYLVTRQGYPKNKVYFLPNGADKTKFFPSPAARARMREKYEFSDREIVFINVARLAAVKDQHTLLEAFLNVYQKNKSVRLVLVGVGEKRPELEQFIAENALSQAVLLAGLQENINDFLNMADVFVLSSQEESLPLALLEAVCVGLPCIVSDAGDMKNWVKHGENGFVFKKKDAVLLSCFLTELAENAILRKTMQQKTGKKSDEMTNPFQHYQQIYQQLINS